MLRTGRFAFVMSSAAVVMILNACGASGPIAGEQQPAGSNLTSVSLALPAKEALPAGTADLLSHFHFAVKVANVGPTADAAECADAADQTAVYSTSTTLEAKLNSLCTYEVSLVLGKADAAGKLELPSVPTANLEGPADQKVPPQTPQSQAAKLFYYSDTIVTPAEMKDQTKLSLTLKLRKLIVGDKDPSKPDTIVVGKDLDLEVNVKFPDERTPSERVPN